MLKQGAAYNEYVCRAAVQLPPHCFSKTLMVYGNWIFPAELNAPRKKFNILIMRIACVLASMNMICLICNHKKQKTAKMQQKIWNKILQN